MEVLVRGQRARVRVPERRARGDARGGAGEGSFSRMAALSARIPEPDSQSQRRRVARAAISGRSATDLAAGVGCGRPLRDLSLGIEGSVAGRGRGAAVPSASADSAFLDRIRMRDVPSGTGFRDDGGGRTQQHKGLGTGDFAGALRRIVVRAVSRTTARRNASTQCGKRHAGAVWLRPLP